MFQYTHELIFNSLTMPDGSPRLIAESGKPLVIKRGGEYFKNFIQSQGSNEHVVYMTKGNVGKYEVLTIDCSKLVPQGEDGKWAKGIYQLNMFVKLLDPHALYEFGYPNYNMFGRQILVGYDNFNEDPKVLAAALYDSLDMALRKEEFVLGGEVEGEELKPFVAGTDTKVSIKAMHYALRFDTVGVSLYDPTMCDSCLGEYLPPRDILHNDDADLNAAEVKVAGVEPFATGEWLQQNLRFPSYPNIRYWAVNGGDYPTPGLTYVQFSFAYQSPRPQLGGLSGVGQAMMAITRHIYYVPEALAEDFKAAFETIGATVVETNAVEVTNPDANAVDGGNTNVEEPVEP